MKKSVILPFLMGVLLFVSAGISVMAQPVFSPGETLDPDCAPGQTGFTSGINGQTGDCSVALPTLTAGSGLNESSGVINLGGILEDNTDIDVQSYILNLFHENIFFSVGNNTVGVNFVDGAHSGSMLATYTPSNNPNFIDDVFIGGFSRILENTSGDTLSQFVGLGAEATQVQIGNNNTTTGDRSRAVFDIDDPEILFDTIDDGSQNAVRINQDGVSFFSDLGEYTFPRIVGATGHVLTSDGAGNIVWQAPSSIQSSQFEIEYNLAQARSAQLLSSNESFTYPGVQQIHEIILVDEYIFGSTRSDPAQLIRINQNDLSDYDAVIFPGEKDSERIVFDEVTGKLYQVFADVDFVDPRVAVYEIDPFTLDTQIIVDHTWPSASGAAVLDTDGEHIYIIQGNNNPLVSKFDITTGSHIDSYQISAPNEVGHNIEYHEGYLFATSSFGDPFFVKIDAQTMTLVDQVSPQMFMQSALLSHTITPTMLFIGDYVYFGYEFGDRDASDASSYVFRYNWRDITLPPTVIDLGIGSGINGMAFDGDYLWFTHNDADVSSFPPVPLNSYISRLDPTTLEYSVAAIDIPAIYKIRSDGKRLFVLAFPFAQDGIIHRFNQIPLFDITGIAGIVDGGRFAVDPRNGVFTFIVADGILQRKFEIQDTGVTIGEYIVPWEDGNAGQVLMTDGAGNISWQEVQQNISASFGRQATNYRIARELNMPYLDENTQVVSIPEFDDATFGGAHGLIYIAEHDVIFASLRTTPGSFIRFNNPNDLTDYDYVEITGVGAYNNPDQLVYSSLTDKVYIILSDFDFSGVSNFRVVEVDPVTLAYSLIIDDDTGQGAIGAPTITIVDNYLYALNGVPNSVLRQYDLTSSTTPIPSSASVSLFDSDRRGHALESDGTHLYATSISFTANEYIAKISLDLSTVEQELIPLGSSSTFGGFTDDLLVWGDYIYALSEIISPETYLFKINKNDLTDYVALDIGSVAPEGLHSIMTDGNYIWFSGPNSILGKLNPLTGEGSLFDTAKYEVTNLNEMTTDGARYFFTGHNEYPVENGEGYVIRTAFPSSVTTRFTLGAEGTQIHTIDTLTGQSTFRRSDGGDVMVIENIIGDCVINPSIMGGIDCSSDETLKTDISPLESSSLQLLSHITPRLYRWVNQEGDGEKTMGFLAQEVREVFPQLVSEDARTGLLRMSYSGLTVPLVGAVQELYTRVLALEALQDWNIGETDSLQEFVLTMLKNAGEVVFNGVVRAYEVITQSIRTERIDTQELCMDGVCISPEQFQELLEFANIDYSESQNQYSSSSGLGGENNQGASASPHDDNPDYDSDSQPSGDESEENEVPENDDLDEPESSDDETHSIPENDTPADDHSDEDDTEDVHDNSTNDQESSVEEGDAIDSDEDQQSQESTPDVSQDGQYDEVSDEDNESEDTSEGQE